MKAFFFDSFYLVSQKKQEFEHQEPGHGKATFCCYIISKYCTLTPWASEVTRFDVK